MKHLDPFYHLLRFLLRGFLTANPTEPERAFVEDNMTKHRKVLWINLFATICVFFGGIPAKLIDMAMSVTFWMFTAFAVSFSAMIVAVMMVSPPLVWPALILIYFGAITACIQYDTSDGFKAGLDEAVLNHSRAALRFYAREGIDPSKPDER